MASPSSESTPATVSVTPPGVSPIGSTAPPPAPIVSAASLFPASPVNSAGALQLPAASSGADSAPQLPAASPGAAMAGAPSTAESTITNATAPLPVIPPSIYTNAALLAASLGHGSGQGHGVNFPGYPGYYPGYPGYAMMAPGSYAPGGYALPPMAPGSYAPPPVASPSLGFGSPAPTTALALPYGSTPPPPPGPAAPSMPVPPMHHQPFPAHGLPPVVTIASSITIRLTSENYLFWRAQVGPLLRSHMLMGYVDGSLPCPSPHVDVSHAGAMHHAPNPAHQHWTQQDQAILSGFVSSMTEGVLGMIMFSGTSREAWETLSGAFASTSIARSSAIRQEMAELKKGNKTVNTYFHQMKALSDSLTSIGEPLRDAEFVSYILAGLDEEYDALYQVVTNRTTPIQIRDLFSQLQATEQRKLAQRRSSSSSHFPAAHIAAPPAAYGAGRGGPRPPTPSAKTAPTATPKQNGGRTPVVCQLCDTPRHVASRCYKRFNRDFLGLGNDGSVTEKQLAMAMSASHGSQGASQSVDPAWYADSGATHHITSELDKLTSREPYHGTDQVHTANGTGIGRGSRLDVFTPSDAYVDHGLHGSAPGCVQPCTAPATELGSALGSVQAEPGDITSGCCPASGSAPTPSFSSAPTPSSSSVSRPAPREQHGLLHAGSLHAQEQLLSHDEQHMHVSAPFTGPLHGSTDTAPAGVVTESAPDMDPSFYLLHRYSNASGHITASCPARWTYDTSATRSCGTEAHS
nr:uncharacterized protein LOC127329110 [Lolium perenne]